MPGAVTYDVFLSSSSNDYPFAEQVYASLTSKGLRVFFSEKSLRHIGTSDYRRAIDAALEGADHMVVVASSRENVSSSWVEAEWGFFLNEKRSGYKTGNLTCILVGGMNPRELPASLRHYQAVPLEALEKVLPFVGVATAAAPQEVPVVSSQGTRPATKNADQIEAVPTRLPVEVLVMFGREECDIASLYVQALLDRGLGARGADDPIRPTELQEDRRVALVRDCVAIIAILNEDFGHGDVANPSLNRHALAYAAELRERRGAARPAIHLINIGRARSRSTGIPKTLSHVPIQQVSPTTPNAQVIDAVVAAVEQQREASKRPL